MKRLTLKRSLELCKELWSWLRDNPNVTSKYDWPKWYRYNEVKDACFACEYAQLEYKKQHKKDRDLIITVCGNCPLKGLWGNKCTKNSSPYNKWYYAVTDKVRQKNADRIVDFCDKELNQLNENRSKNGKKN